MSVVGNGGLTQVLSRGEPTRIEGKHPRTLYTVDVGKHMSCGEESIDAGSEVPLHFHKSSEEVLRCTQGQGTLYVGRGPGEDAELREIRFEPGVSALVPAGTRHRIVNLSQDEELWLSWTLSPPLKAVQFKASSD